MENEKIEYYAIEYLCRRGKDLLWHVHKTSKMEMLYIEILAESGFITYESYGYYSRVVRTKLGTEFVNEYLKAKEL